MESNPNNIVPVTWNRLEDGLCVSCGEQLLDTTAEMGMCSQCFKKAKKAAWKQISNRKKRTGDVKRIKVKFPVWMINKKP